MNPKSDFAWPWAHVTGTGAVSDHGGALHSIQVNGLTTAGDATVRDGGAGGDILAVLHLDPATSVSVQPLTFHYDAKLDHGLYIAYDQNLAADLTVMYI